MSRTTSVVIRPARADDRLELLDLAELDSKQPVADTNTLVAEIDDHIVAALGVESGARIANPFVATADVLALLDLRASRTTSAVARQRRRLAIPHVRARARAA